MRTVKEVVALLDEHGIHVEPLDRAGGGTGVAYEVALPCGRRILKWQERGEGTPFDEVATSLAALNARGYPVPAYEVLLRDPVEVSVQAILQGSCADELPDAVVEDLDRLIDLQAGLGATVGEAWGVRLQRTTLVGAETWCRHDSLERHSQRTRDLWKQARAVTEGIAVAAIPDGDLVHMDYHHRNVLQRDGRVTGVFDWEGVEPGDRAFDRFTLAFYCGVAGWSDSKRRHWLARLVTDSVADAAGLYLAHLSVRSVDWAIRKETEDDVTMWLDWSMQALELIP
jgi:hypothetical protein